MLSVRILFLLSTASNTIRSTEVSLILIGCFVSGWLRVRMPDVSLSINFPDSELPFFRMTESAAETNGLIERAILNETSGKRK
jgi:hypothetical protein